MDIVLGDPLFWIGFGLIIIVFFAVTMDIIVIPTMITSIVALGIWFVYLLYVYQKNSTIAFFLGVVFLLLGMVYIFLVIKLRLWKWVSHQKKVPMPLENHEEKIRELNLKEVVAHTDLRPVGKIRVAGKTYDGLSETGFITRGTTLTIIDYVEGQYKVKSKVKKK